MTLKIEISWFLKPMSCAIFAWKMLIFFCKIFFLVKCLELTVTDCLFFSLFLFLIFQNPGTEVEQQTLVEPNEASLTKTLNSKIQTSGNLFHKASTFCCFVIFMIPVHICTDTHLRFLRFLYYLLLQHSLLYSHYKRSHLKKTRSKLTMVKRL